MSVQVVFEYDETVKKWDCWVTGTKNETEARQAFSAVVLSCHLTPASLLTKTGVIKDGERYVITPWEVQRVRYYDQT